MANHKKYNLEVCHFFVRGFKNIKTHFDDLSYLKSHITDILKPSENQNTVNLSEYCIGMPIDILIL